MEMKPFLKGEVQILLLEDDPAIANAIAFAVQREGFKLTHCPLLSDARRELAARHFDLALLDVGLPDGNGLDLCRDIRAHGQTSNMPILVLSARSEEIDRVLGLELGADDYVAKPFSPRELLARIRALLRRSAKDHGAPADRSGTPGNGESDFQIDVAGQRISYRGRALNLTRREHGLLLTLLQGPGRIYTRDVLLDAVWGQAADSTDRTVDTHIKTLRAKLRASGVQGECITTHRGMGYSLDKV